jgi:hypothetical protein
MQTTAFLAVLLSAVLHATWNAIARSGKEPGDVLATGVVISGGVGVLGVLAFGGPAAPSCEQASRCSRFPPVPSCSPSGHSPSESLACC